ncbi:MAG: hypothetical protein ACE5IR_21765, partial [bacterium]
TAEQLGPPARSGIPIDAYFVTPTIGSEIAAFKYILPIEAVRISEVMENYRVGTLGLRTIADATQALEDNAIEIIKIPEDIYFKLSNLTYDEAKEKAGALITAMPKFADQYLDTTVERFFVALYGQRLDGQLAGSTERIVAVYDGLSRVGNTALTIYGGGLGAASAASKAIRAGKSLYSVTTKGGRKILRRSLLKRKYGLVPSIWTTLPGRVGKPMQRLAQSGRADTVRRYLKLDITPTVDEYMWMLQRSRRRGRGFSSAVNNLKEELQVLKNKGNFSGTDAIRAERKIEKVKRRLASKQAELKRMKEVIADVDAAISGRSGRNLLAHELLDKDLAGNLLAGDRLAGQRVEDLYDAVVNKRIASQFPEGRRTLLESANRRPNGLRATGGDVSNLRMPLIQYIDPEKLDVAGVLYLSETFVNKADNALDVARKIKAIILDARLVQSRRMMQKMGKKKIDKEVMAAVNKLKVEIHTPVDLSRNKNIMNKVEELVGDDAAKIAYQHTEVPFEEWRSFALRDEARRGAIFPDEADFKTIVDGKPHYANSIFEDKTRPPHELLAELTAEMRVKLSKLADHRDLARKNSELLQLHDDFIKKGIWRMDGITDSLPDDGLWLMKFLYKMEKIIEKK